MKEVLITSSILIAVIMLLRWLLRGKVSQRLIYAAWLLVALRLLIPVQIGQLDFSLLTAAQPVTQAVEQVTDRQVAGVTEQDAYRQVLQEYIEKDPSVFTPEVQNHIRSELVAETPKDEIAVMIDKVYAQQEVFIPEAQPQVQQKVEAAVDPITLGQVLIVVWLAGVAVMAAWFITDNLIFLRRAKKNSVEAEFEGVRVRISPNVPTPCVVGLLRPVIYLTPAVAENEQGRGHVLAHEQAHIRHGDHIWALIRCLCLCIYWFDPLIWIAAAQSRRDCELACDESALKKLGDGERIAYGKTLLDVVSQSVSPAHLIHTATAMNESKKQLTERVKYIVKKPRNILIAAVCLILVASIATGCAFLGAASSEENRENTPAVMINGSVTKPGYKRVFLITEVTEYTENGTLYVQHTYSYDVLGQVVTHEYQYPGKVTHNSKITYSRNDKGYLTTVTTEESGFGGPAGDGYEQVFVVNYDNYVFDEEDRLISYDYTDDYGTTTCKFDYDNMGRLILRTKQRPRLDAENNSFVYDANGRLSKIITPFATMRDFYENEFTYDDQGRLISMTNGLEAGINYSGLVTYEYDDYGRIVRESNPNNNELTYIWENGVRTAINSDSIGLCAVDQSYELDEFGNVIRINWGGKLTEFKYVAANLPDEYADRALKHHCMVAPRNILAAYCYDISEYVYPYGMPNFFTWEWMAVTV